MKINILGTEYTIITKALDKDYPKLLQRDGYTDFSIKKIVVAKFDEDESSIENLEYYEKKVIRHEIIHAFLFESGLAENSTDRWATNEEMVDYFAFQIPKLIETFKELDAI
ncbi:MAG: hypothetical protein IKQ33_01800 [Clostridia bacterium]|nr:hypothetical protein [Clostridia bacterium]